MPRAERPLEGPAAEFAAELRQLRHQAGSPTYRELARRTHYSTTTLSDAAGGQRLPTLEVTLAYAKACGGDPQEWERRWHQATAPEPEPIHDERKLNHMALVAGVLALLVLYWIAPLTTVTGITA